jgi:hypothetical protein
MERFIFSSKIPCDRSGEQALYPDDAEAWKADVRSDTPN